MATLTNDSSSSEVVPETRPVENRQSANRSHGGRRGTEHRDRSSAISRESSEQYSNGAVPNGSRASNTSNRGRERGRPRPRGHNNNKRGAPNAGGRSAMIAGGPVPANTQPPPIPGGNGVFGTRLSKDAETPSSHGEVAGRLAPSGDDAEAEVCFICASPVAHNSVAPCNHRTCHICSLRMRALYKSKACAHCRTESAVVIFTDEPDKRFEDFQESDFFKTDANLGINYDKPEIFEDTVLLLRYNCPDASCDVACMGWPDLHRHVRSVHQKVMCDLCTRNKKVFTHEHELFTHQELRKHEKFGDDNPGAVDQSGFKGHPECGFCRQRFYGDDELYAHCRDKHERCHVCDRRDGGQNPQYFMNYEALEKHFSKDHFLCLDQECLEKKFVVFDSEMDLKAHQLEMHPNGLSKDARRDARRVDLSTFDYRPQYQEPRRGGRRAGRGRDPNSDHTPATSTGHQSRAEIAHQRELAIHSAQSVSSRSFGGQLSQAEPVAQTVHRPPRSPTMNSHQNVAATRESEITLEAPALGSGESLTPQEQARRLHHSAVINRASSLCKNDKVKMDEFRERISAFRSSSITASDLIDAFFALFDTTSDNLGKLVKELADIFEVAGKRNALLKAWSDWKAINEDYPSLPGPSGANTTASGVLGLGVGTSRVLKLKSSTAQSSRSAAGRPATWKSPLASTPSATPSNAFPSLPSKATSASRGSAAPTQTSGWLAVRPAASMTHSAAGAPARSPATIQQRPSAGAGLVDAFPALPPGKKPTATVFSPGYRGAGVIRTNSSTAAANAWGSSASSGGPSDATSSALEEASLDGNAKKKGNKGKKQVVFQWG